MRSTLIISDLHCPIQHPQAWEFLQSLQDEFNFNEVICIGDEAEMHNFSKWQKHPDSPGIEEEVLKTIKELKTLYGMFPKMKICRSNHTFRFLKRAYEAGLSAKMLKDIRDILEAPRGWVWQDKWVINGVMYMHGEEGSDPRALIKQYRMNVVVGHAHSKAGVTYINNGINQSWCLQTGCLLDPDSYGMAYNKMHMDKPVLGTGIIYDDVPQFIPLKV